jgi:hypothetical protein
MSTIYLNNLQQPKQQKANKIEKDYLKNGEN